MAGKLEEDIGQERCGGITAGEEDIDELKAQGHRVTNLLGKFVKEYISAIGRGGGLDLFRLGGARGEVEGAVNMSVNKRIKPGIRFWPGLVKDVAE